MPLMEWTDKFNLGVEQFDAHHQHLVALLNDAYDNFVRDSNVEGLAATLDELFAATIKHFNVEAQFMEASYADYTEHRELHKSFSAQVAVMQQDLRSGWGDIAIEMLTYLKNWLTYNILIADANYVRCASGSQWKQCA